ncbi:MAG: imidazolonepropionase [Myxococcota bacterium]|jgi:imidazolonepropionase|nr:imidazolonepropionase [Myxococcota bacterium]
MMQHADILIINAGQLLTMEPSMSQAPQDDRDLVDTGCILDGAVALRDGRVAAVGRTVDLMAEFKPKQIIDATGRVVCPGFVDPHTHLVFAGSRHLEFGLRMRGATYHEILAKGGGIHSTVQATRAASHDELEELALPRLRRLLCHGVTTVEVKSGYGLDAAAEIKILEVVQRLAGRQSIRLCPTYLGAHVVPVEFKEDRSAYLRLMVHEVLPEIARRGLATACDAFIDQGAFEVHEARIVLETARSLGLMVKAHAGQFSACGAPALVAELGGLSADHLEVVTDEDIAAMAAAGVVATLLPGAALCLRDEFPSGRRFLDRGVEVAVATDLNPGTSRTENLPLMGVLAATRQGLSVAEALRAMTVSAAKALGLSHEVGSLRPGSRGDIVVLDVLDVRDFFYHFGQNHVFLVIAAGAVALEREQDR